MTKIIIIHPTGNEFFKAAINGFYEAGCLGSIYTSVASFPGTLSYQLGSLKKFSDIKRRVFNNNVKNITHTHPWKEIGRLFAVKAGMKKLVQHEMGAFSVDEVYKSLDKYVAKKLSAEKRQGIAVIYAYEDGAYYSFQKARELYIKCVYDLPIGYWRSMHALLEAEKEINPGWAATMDGLKDSPGKLSRKDREINLADAVFVASSFTAATLKEYPLNMPPVYTIPYGFPPVSVKAYTSFSPFRKIRLLFVGGLSQRKGLSYLFEAVKGLEQFIELTVVGRLSQANCEPLNRALRKHVHISSLPHQQILELMHAHDVLIFPSLFEGFGQVITEAMAQGTPVITTERTAGPDIIRHGENGWLVKAGDMEGIKNILEQLIAQPAVIAEAGMQAAETARKRPWSSYGEELAKTIMAI